MQQTQMLPGPGPEPKITVMYEGSDTLLNGYALCSNSDYGTAANEVRERMTRAEKPAAGNIHRFLGVVVGLGSGGKPGPCQVQLARPAGCLSQVYTSANCTIDSTWLYLQLDSYILGVCGPVRVAQAAQTVNRSSTNGLCLARLMDTDIPRPADQEANTSTTFTGAIWDNFPIADLRRNPHLGTWLEYDPTFRPEQQIPERAEYTGAHNSVTETHVAATTLAAIERNLVISEDASAADNDACAVQFPGPVTISGGKPWAFEVDFDVTTVTDDDMETFIGLMEASTLADEMPYSDGGAYAAAVDLIGFELKGVATGGGAGLDSIYKAGADTVVTHQADVGTLVANTAVTAGMYYNGTTIAVYVNGTAKTVIAAADIADVTTDTFPAAVVGYLTAAIKGDSGVADGDDLNIRAFRVAQLA